MPAVSVDDGLFLEPGSTTTSFKCPTPQNLIFWSCEQLASRHPSRDRRILSMGKSLCSPTVSKKRLGRMCTALSCGVKQAQLIALSSSTTFIVLCCAVQCCAMLCCIVLCRVVLCCAVQCCAMLCYAVLCCVVLCCSAVQCCAVVLCSVVLCCAVLYCAVLYCAVLYCVVLCCAVLCYAMLCCVVLRCAMQCCAEL